MKFIKTIAMNCTPDSGLKKEEGYFYESQEVANISHKLIVFFDSL